MYSLRYLLYQHSRQYPQGQGFFWHPSTAQRLGLSRGFFFVASIGVIIGLAALPCKALGVPLDPVEEVLLTRDGVPAVHGFGLVPGEPHGDRPGHPGALEVPDDSTAEVVEPLAHKPGLSAGSVPQVRVSVHLPHLSAPAPPKDPRDLPGCFCFEPLRAASLNFKQRFKPREATEREDPRRAVLRIRPDKFYSSGLEVDVLPEQSGCFATTPASQAHELEERPVILRQVLEHAAQILITPIFVPGVVDEEFGEVRDLDRTCKREESVSAFQAIELELDGRSGPCFQALFCVSKEPFVGDSPNILIKSEVFPNRSERVSDRSQSPLPRDNVVPDHQFHEVRKQHLSFFARLEASGHRLPPCPRILTELTGGIVQISRTPASWGFVCSW